MLLFLFACALFLNAQELRVGLFYHEPNVWVDERDGTPRGPTVEYVEKVLSHLGYKAVVYVLPMARMLRMLEDGSLDLAADLSKTPQREAFLWYPDSPSLLLRTSLSVRASSALVTVSSVRQLEGLTIGYLADASPGAFFADARGIRFDVVSGNDWVRQNYRKLLSGRIDAALDQNPWSYQVEAIRRGEGGRIRTIELEGPTTGYYLVFSRKSPYAKRLLEAFNELQKKALFDEQAMLEAWFEDFSRSQERIRRPPHTLPPER